MFVLWTPRLAAVAENKARAEGNSLMFWLKTATTDNRRHENGIAAAAEISSVVFAGLKLTQRLEKRRMWLFLQNLATTMMVICFIFLKRWRSHSVSKKNRPLAGTLSYTGSSASSGTASNRPSLNTSQILIFWETLPEL